MGENIPEYVIDLLATLETAGHEAWCVGGCVRDLLRGCAPSDWDVTTSALPEETMTLFGERALPTGLRHGTVSVKTTGGTVEVTTFRLDGTYSDHRRPDIVTFTHSLEEDLRRRDFTVNAMALDRRGELRDPFGGQEDLANRCLRCVGTADRRFTEDALRILRGLRFAAVLGFSIEEETAKSIYRNRMLLRDIAPERVRVEFFKLLAGPACVPILRSYVDVIGVFWPELLAMVGFDQRNYHHCYDVWEHTLHALETVESDALLRCAVLLHDVGKPRTFTLDEAGVGHFYGHATESEHLADEMLGRLRCANAFRDAVLCLIRWHDRAIQPTEPSVGRALRLLGEEDLRRLLAVKRADNLGQAPAYRGRQTEIRAVETVLDQLLTRRACFSLKQLAVNGHDLLELGFSGPAVGRMLERLLEQVTEGTLPNERQALLLAAKQERCETL